jgi:hypothetical protein
VLFSFNGTDGAEPRAGLIFDKAGNLYGTASSGGNPNTCPASTGFGAGCGLVFELAPPSGGKSAWTETTVFSLNDVMGNNPLVSLILDAKGMAKDLYGDRRCPGSVARSCICSSGARTYRNDLPR